MSDKLPIIYSLPRTFGVSALETRGSVNSNEYVYAKGGAGRRAMSAARAHIVHASLPAWPLVYVNHSEVKPDFNTKKRMA
jgi:hypothetical protein